MFPAWRSQYRKAVELFGKKALGGQTARSMCLHLDARGREVASFPIGGALGGVEALPNGNFLVPQPTGNGGLDRLNSLYPGLWETGAGFATLAKEFDGGWRLYKLIGPTGR